MEKTRCEVCPHVCMDSLNHVSWNVYDQFIELLNEMRGATHGKGRITKDMVKQFAYELSHTISYLSRDESTVLDQEGFEKFMDAYEKWEQNTKDIN
jgi:hypothetical protein